MRSFRLELVLLSLAVLAMAGCESTTFEDTIFDKEYVARHLPSEEKVLRQSMFEPRATGVVQTYCYSTIGEVECYAHPRPEERYRLNGYFGPSPE
jgi:uncharacterized protein YcfL